MFSFDVAGRAVLVTGGDEHAARDVAALLAAGADVTVRAAEVCAAVQDLADRGLISWQPAAPENPPDYDVVLRPRPRSQPTEAREAGRGSVVLVGGGPGDESLLTVAGRDAVAQADVVVMDRLAPWGALAWARPDAEIIDVAKIPFGRSTSQEVINTLLVEHATAGRRVVRLKGGDSFVFGRGMEEVQACAAAGVPTRVIPGVTASISAPALAGIPVTHRGLSQGFTVISGHVPPGHPQSTLDYGALARSGTTLVVLMGVHTLPAIVAALLAAGMDPATPAAVVADGSRPSQQVVVSTLAELPGAVARAGVQAPAVAVIGDVVSTRAVSPAPPG
ncbi:uroporphyrinogen-III C-methyltransferase [Rhodococcus sp. X156]|uniref:uroporphyrinogen-III C-methyltransferase n=1 Tax=Rhodococcus sp. X156 TaxID=2499145 RepID=UPI0019D2EFEA|nr:uroporphyrinogen-III C-methyltransferase [Rhodococcus sp. X156]